MGMALTSCTPPAKGSPLFDLGDDEMEMGVGIHGEPGRRREKLASANEIVDELLEAVVTDLPFGRGDDAALMINGLGGTPISELYRHVDHLEPPRPLDHGLARGARRDRHPDVLIAIGRLGTGRNHRSFVPMMLVATPPRRGSHPTPRHAMSSRSTSTRPTSSP
jgi:Dak1 domain